MKKSPIDLLHDALGPALWVAFLRAADIAKQTRTYLVFQEGDAIKRIPYQEIDVFVAQKLSAKKR